MKKVQKRLSWLLTLIMILSMLLPMGSVWAEDSSAVTITVLGTADIHGMIYNWEYSSDTEQAAAGMVKLQTLIKEEKARNNNVILVDAGDTVQGNMMSVYNANPVHPVVEAMNLMGYDTWTLGNHEFNYGLDFLNRNIAGFKGKVLAANLYNDDGTRKVNPYAIIEKSGVRVAVVGLTNPNVPTLWEAANPANTKGLKFTDPVDEAKKVVKELEGKYDVLIGTFHLGETTEYTKTDGASAVADACPQFNAILAAHAHSKFDNKTSASGVKIIEPGNNGTLLAKIDVALEKVNGIWTVKEVKTANVNTDKISPDQELKDKFSGTHNALRKEADIVIGEVTARFIDKPDYLTGADKITTMPTAQVQDNAIIDLINEVQMYYAGTDISSAAFFKADANLNKGALKNKDMATIYMYDNTLVGVNITGANLKKYMEWSANYYNTYKAGDIAPGFNPAVRGYNYDIFDGIQYDIDISKPESSRIVNLTYKGQPVDDSKIYKLAVNSYRYGSQLLSMKLVTPADKFFDSEQAFGSDMSGMRALIGKYVKEKLNGKLAPKVDNNWKIIGANYEHPLKSEIITKVKEGKITVPKSFDGRTLNVKALNVYDYMKLNEAADTKVVSLMAMNDFHATAVGDAKNPGLAKLASYVNYEKAKNKAGTILLSAGDMSQGSADSNLLYGKPIITAMNELGFEAMAIGNHEFDWGLDKLETMEKQAKFPFLAANIVDKATGKTTELAKPYVIIEKNGVKVGVIGVTTPETEYKTKASVVGGFEFKNPAEVVNALVPEVKKAGADIVVVLGHIGANQDPKTQEISGEAAELAKLVTGVDAIIAGHSHQTVSGKVNNIPIIQGWYNGRAVGHIDFYVDAKTKAITRMDYYVDNLQGMIKDLTEDARFKNWFSYIQSLNNPILNVKVGNAAADLSRATSKDAQVSPLGKWAADAVRKAGNAEIAILNGGGIRSDIAAGDITMRSMYTFMPFDNTLYTAELTGKQVKAAIEHGLLTFKEDGTTVEGFGSGQFSGINVQYDSNKPYGQRIVSITLLDGTPVDDNKLYKVASMDFLALENGDKYGQFFKDAKNGINTGMTIRDVYVNEIKSKGVITPVEDNRCMDVNKTSMLYYDLAA